jgi:hypothetical protein
MRAVRAALRSLGITRVRGFVRLHLPSASCAAGWTTAVAFASSSCRCAAGSNTFTMSAAGSTTIVLDLPSAFCLLCCRVDDYHHIPVLAFISLQPPVLQGGRLPSPSRRLPCHCAAGSTMLVVLSERNFSSCAAGSTMLFGLTERNFSSCAAGSTMLVLLSTKIFFLCCRVDDSLCCRVGPAHSCAAGSQTPGDFGQCSGDDVEATFSVLQGG